jgi:MFS transporter, DHA1 family, multidrug resistance protein
VASLVAESPERRPSGILVRYQTRSRDEIRQTDSQHGALEKTTSKPISLSRSADGTILVDWYSTDDPDNPQNWSQGKKLVMLMQIW